MAGFLIIVGYEIGKNIDSELSMSALGNAIALRGRHKGLIFHSDRGSQYSSKKYKAMLNENGITGSMSAPGCPYDNSCVDSFFANLKNELIYRKKYATIEEVSRVLSPSKNLDATYTHLGLGASTPTIWPINVTYDVGLVKNPDDKWKYAGPFIDGGAGAIVGFDYCGMEKVRALSFTVGSPYGIYIGYDYYWPIN